MKTILSAVFLVLFITNSLQSQFLPEWVKISYSAADSTIADPITVMDSDNNIYSTFTVRHLSTAYSNIVTVKSNSAGDVIWLRYAEQNNNLHIRYPRAISLDGAGNVYIFSTLTDTTRSEFKVTKYSSTGTQLWAYTYSLSSNHYSFVTDGITDNNGNSYFTGYAKDVWSSVDTTYLFKVDNAGNLNWVKKNISDFYGFIYNIGSPKVALDAQNNVIFTTFKVQNFLSNILTQKYDPAGNMLWSKEYDNNGLWDYPFAIKTDNANNVFVTGVAGSTLQIDSGYTLLLKYNSAGVQQYATTHRLTANIPDYGYKLKIDNASGQIYVLSRNQGDFTSIRNDLILKKFDANGVVVWANKYENTNNIYEIGNSLDLDNSGDPIVAGNHHNRGQSKMLMLKYNKVNGSIVWNFPYNYSDNNPYGTTDVIIRNNHIFVTGSKGYSLLNMKLAPSQQNSVTITRSVSKPILDMQSTFDTISFSPDMLPPDAYITDVNVTLDSILHPFVGDLEISLIHSQYKDTLVYRRGFSGDNFIGTVLDDTAETPICNSNAAPFTGYFKPCRPLSQFNSLLTEGPWILQIYDRKSSDTGELKAWTLTVAFNTLIGITQISSEIPSVFLLSQNYPNPFNPNTRIKFSVPKSSFVKLTVYDMLGKELKTVVDNFLNAGVYESDLDMSNYSSGIYFYMIETNEFTETKKMILIK